jgi:hypothetical protein
MRLSVITCRLGCITGRLHRKIKYRACFSRIRLAGRIQKVAFLPLITYFFQPRSRITSAETIRVVRRPRLVEMRQWQRTDTRIYYRAL